MQLTRSALVSVLVLFGATGVLGSPTPNVRVLPKVSPWYLPFTNWMQQPPDEEVCGGDQTTQCNACLNSDGTPTPLGTLLNLPLLSSFLNNLCVSTPGLLGNSCSGHFKLCCPQNTGVCFPFFLILPNSMLNLIGLYRYQQPRGFEWEQHQCLCSWRHPRPLLRYKNKMIR
jgi:hypothetical protein